MALSEADWADIRELVEGYATDIGSMSPEKKRLLAWRKAQERANPHCCRNEFFWACHQYGWPLPDKHFWDTVKPPPYC